MEYVISRNSKLNWIFYFASSLSVLRKPFRQTNLKQYTDQKSYEMELSAQSMKWIMGSQHYFHDILAKPQSWCSDTLRSPRKLRSSHLITKNKATEKWNNGRGKYLQLTDKFSVVVLTPCTVFWLGNFKSWKRSSDIIKCFVFLGSTWFNWRTIQKAK